MEVRSRRRAWIAPVAALASIVATSSCLLTSNFDGLTGNDTTSSGTSASSANGGAGGRGGGGASSTSSSGGGPSSTGAGAGGSGGGACMAKNIGGAFPATCVLDDFNRADGDPGVNWLVQNVGDYTISNDHLVTPMPMGSEDLHPGTALWSDTLGPTQEVFIKLSAFTTADFELELILKAQGGPEECGSLQVSYHQGVLDASYCEVSQNMFVELPQGGANVTFNPGDQLGARATADGKLIGYRNGQVVAIWDSTGFSAYAASGRVGIEMDGIHDALAFDDFGGGGQ